MSNPRSSSSGTATRPSKRMRLGTRSCVECRRRKVRCIFVSNKARCEGCTVHDEDCFPQGTTKVPGSNLESEDGKDVHQKLATLEGMVRRIYDTIDLDAELSTSKTPSTENTTKQVLDQLRAKFERECTGQSNATSLSNDAESTADTDELADLFVDAPLLKLFQDSMLIQTNTKTLSSINKTEDPHLLQYVSTFRTMLPESNQLQAVLKITQPFWPIWKYGQGLSFTPDPDSLSSVSAVQQFILDSMDSTNPAIVAKAVLFLALCIQQLPHHTSSTDYGLPSSISGTLDSYMKLADMLLSIREYTIPTLDGLKCLEVAAKLLMNMGKPRECWLTNRRATNLALLLRLHTWSSTTPERQRSIWSHLWQTDRQLSTILGIPCATSDSHPGVSLPSSISTGERVMHGMSVMAGHINELNQDFSDSNYAKVIQIDQELRTLLESIPSDWWITPPTPSIPIEYIYGVQSIKIQFYMLQKILHQPYMLKSFTDLEFEPSRSVACDASREMIYAYLTLRKHNGMELLICDLMDFQVFTAAIVLLIRLTYSPDPRNHGETGDWELVRNVTESMKHVSENMHCSVATQAYQTLEHLTSAFKGQYTGPETYEVVIPYFGRVKINRNSQKEPVYEQTLLDQQLEQIQIPSTIDFSANWFEPVSWNQNADYLDGKELGVDWGSLVDDGVLYDWSQHFEWSQPETDIYD